MIEHIHRYLDAAVLKPEFSREESKAAIENCIHYKTKTVCVRPCDIELAAAMCRGTETEVSCVLAFPHGTAPANIKALAAADYIQRGTNEIDMVANFGYIRSGMWDEVKVEIQGVVAEAKPAGVPVKVIFETCFLSLEEIRKAVAVSIEAGADYVKTSTGFGSGGATEDAVKTMVEAAAGRIKVKASGGIRSREDAETFIRLGAERLGNGYTSNRAIIEGDAAGGNEAY